MALPRLHFELILPDNSPPYRAIKPWPGDPRDSIDDDDSFSHDLICLYDVGRAFTVYGVRFQISGFFVEPPPVDTEIDLIMFLQDLPYLLAFLKNPAGTTCTVMLMEQGLEVEFHFRGIDNNTRVQVSCISHVAREMKSTCEVIPLDDLVIQIITFIENYREGLERYAGHLLEEPWNKNLLAAQVQLKSGLRNPS